MLKILYISVFVFLNFFNIIHNIGGRFFDRWLWGVSQFGLPQTEYRIVSYRRKTLKNQQRHKHTQQTQADTQKKEQISTKPTKIL